MRIVGLPEEEQENTKSLSLKFFEEDLQIQGIHVSEAFRIGKKDQGTRPILVRFANKDDKGKVMKQKFKLKGKFIWLNDDLTKEQLQDKKQEIAKFKEAKTKNQPVKWVKGKVVVG